MLLDTEKVLFSERDDRREIRRMLELLPVARRLEWLRWCCEQVSVAGVTTYVESSSGTVNSVFGDAMTLAFGSGLTVRRAGDRLHDMVRRRV